jgi:hypothetical protein
MISAIAFVLFVRDKYTINILSGSAVAETAGDYLMKEEEIKRKNSNIMRVIGVVFPLDQK